MCGFLIGLVWYIITQPVDCTLAFSLVWKSKKHPTIFLSKACAFKSVQLDGLYYIVKYNLYSLRSWWNCCAWVGGRAAVAKQEQRSCEGKLICIAPNLHASPLPKHYSTRLLIPPAMQAITYAFLNAFFKRKTYAQYQSIVFAEVVLFHTKQEKI